MLTKKLYVSLFIVFISMTFFTGANGKTLILEIDDINFFSVKEDLDRNNQVVLTGLAMNSSMAVGEVKILFMKESLHVKIVMVPSEKGLRGDFHIPVYTGENVKTIYFGNKKAPVWKRE